MDVRRLLKMSILSIAFTVLLVFVYNQLITDSYIFRFQVSKIERSLKGQEIEDPTGRSSLNNVSYETFKQNPFWGIGIPPWQSYDKIGEHNTWVDYLANFGIFGVLPLYLFLSIRIAKRFFVHNDYLVEPGSIIYLKISITLFLIANFISPLITVPHSYQFFLFLYSSTQTKVSI
jgi:O-antigen ligase